MDILDDNTSFKHLITTYLSIIESTKTITSLRPPVTDEEIDYIKTKLMLRPHLSTLYRLREHIQERRKQNKPKKRLGLQEGIMLMAKNMLTGETIGPLTANQLAYKLNGTYTTIASAVARKSVVYGKWIIIKEGNQFFRPKTTHYQITDISTGEKNTYFNLQIASEAIGTSKSQLCQAVRKDKLLKKRFSVKKIDF